MTLRNKTLTAVAALSLSAAGFAFAQTAPTVPAEEPEQTQQSTETEAPAAEAPAADAPAAPAEPAADTEAVGEQPADAAPAAEETAPADTDAPAEAEQPAGAPAATEPPAEAEATAEEPAAEEAPAADPAAEGAAAENLEEQPAPEPTDQAAPETEAEQDAPAGTEAETGAEAEDAAAPTEAVETEAETDEAAAAAGDPEAAEDHGAAEGEEAGGSHGAGHIEDITFSFEGPFGKYDQFQLQRGLQVYTEVCSACHGMKFVPIRTIGDEGGPGLPENQVRAYAANLTPIIDADSGEERPREATDHFPTVSGEGMGPDLSLMAKARAGFHGPEGTGINQLLRGIGGPEYIHAVLTGYTGEETEQAGTVLYHNTAFPGGNISMPPPLSEGIVTYEDGTEATVDQMSIDVSAFLMWTAEPKMMDRKMVGFSAVLLLSVLTALLYYTNKRLWAPFKGKDLHKQS